MASLSTSCVEFVYLERGLGETADAANRSLLSGQLRLSK